MSSKTINERASEFQSPFKESSGIIEKNGKKYYRLKINHKESSKKDKIAEIEFKGDPKSNRDLSDARAAALGYLISKSRKTGDRDWSSLVLMDLNFKEATKEYLRYSKREPTGENGSRTDLSGFVFNECTIKKPGKNGNGTTFGETILNNTSFDKLNAESETFDISGANSNKAVSMCGIKVGKLKGAGSKLKFPLLRGSVIGHIDLINTKDDRGEDKKVPAIWESGLYSQMELRGGTIERASMINGDWGNSISVGVDASGADLRDTYRDKINKSIYKIYEESVSVDPERANYKKVEGILENRDFPNKVRGAVFVNMTIDKDTQLNGMNRRSLKISNAVRKVSKLGFTSAAVLMMGVVDMMGFGWVDGALSSFGKGNVLLITSALDFAKSKVFEDFIGSKIRDKVNNFILAGQKNVVGNARALMERMRNLRVVCGGSEGMEPIMRAMHMISRSSKKPGAMKSLYRAIKGDGGVVVVCNERMLAKAVAYISNNRNREYSVKREITLARVGAEKNSAVASTLTFHKDGHKTLSYLEGDEVILVTADENNRAYSKIEMVSGRQYNLSGEKERGFIYDEGSPFPTIDGAIDLFERSILDQNGLQNWRYDSDTSYLTVGENGKTLFVHNNNTKELHSREGHALLHLSKSKGGWVGRRFIDGQLKTKEEFDHSNRMHKRRESTSTISPPSKIEESLRAVKKSFQEQFAKTGRLTPAQMKAQENIDRSLSRLST